MRWCTLLLVLLLLGGCASKPTASLPDQPDIPRVSRFTSSLQNTAQHKGQVYMYAPEEQTQVVEAPSCEASRGATLYTGSYTFYLQPAGADRPEPQAVAPFGTELLTFSNQRRQVWVVRGEPGQQPDLLMVSQYGSCNGDVLAVLGLSPDGRRLVHYRFRLADGRTTNTTGFKELAFVGPQLRTKIYNNATGKYTTTTWEVREADGLLVAVQTEVK